MAERELGKRSIFRSIFVPLILVMLLQSAIFYLAAMYGGVEQSLRRNAADILSEKLQTQKGELEARFNNRSFDLGESKQWLTSWYQVYEAQYGDKPLLTDQRRQIDFLGDCADALVDTLRQNEVNGVFLILNDSAQNAAFAGESEKKYGLCIRDLDQDSNYTGRKDLLLERSPSSIVDQLDVTLDSWWEAWYTFHSEQEGDYYYKPLRAAWAHPGADGSDLAYYAGAHQISGSDQVVVSYSIPLTDENGYPYAVFGVELTTKYLASLLPNNGLDDMSAPCYVLATRTQGDTICTPIVGAGALYARCFGNASVIDTGSTDNLGGYSVLGRGNIKLYGDAAKLTLYNNNNPFENDEVVLLAMADSDALFAHIGRVQVTLLVVSLGCLLLGLAAIWAVSRHFAAPITALAKRARSVKPEEGVTLGRVGITEIDQLVSGIETLSRDVSRSSARTEFFSRMSHDMRTPMNAIISFSSPELLAGADEKTKDDFLTKIHASGNYLLGLINEVLDMTKIESDKVELHAEAVAAKDLCYATIPIISELAKKKGVAFLSEIQADDGLSVLVDAQHLDQIVMNLLSNAVKFTKPGGRVRFTAHLTKGKGDAVSLEIVVSDTGIGMSETFMQSLFKPFEQENPAHEGTGLGLSIAKKLIELMGGDISCRSEQGVGTTFTVTLPLTACEVNIESAGTASADKADLQKLRGRRVLLCEDNDLNIEIMLHLLRGVGMLADVAKNGREGVDAFIASAENAYDAILMDVRMPVMDGIEATRAIRALPRADAKTVPIIALTANAFSEDVQATREAGMDEHLAKPLEAKRLFETLYRYTCA